MPVFDVRPHASLPPHNRRISQIACNLMRQAVREDERCNREFIARTCSLRAELSQMSMRSGSTTTLSTASTRPCEVSTFAQSRALDLRCGAEEVRDWRYRPTLMARLQLYHNRYCELLDGLSSRSLGSPPPLPDDFLTYEPDSRSNSSSISSKASFSSLSDVSFSSDSSVPSPGVWEEGCSPHWVPLDDDPSIMIPAWLPASLPPWAPVNIWSFP